MIKNCYFFRIYRSCYKIWNLAKNLPWISARRSSALFLIGCNADGQKDRDKFEAKTKFWNTIGIYSKTYASTSFRLKPSGSKLVLLESSEQ